jgi:hypothetical protein
MKILGNPMVKDVLAVVAGTLALLAVALNGEAAEKRNGNGR